MNDRQSMGTQSNPSSKAWNDGLGLVLFSAGAFFLVLSLLALLKGLPTGGGRGSMALAQRFIGSVGVVPGLVASLGLTAVGAMLFLGVRVARPGRWVVASLATGLALSVLFGALGPGGGRFGAATGGMLAAKTHVVLGAFVGLVATGLVLWFSLLRGELATSGGGTSASKKRVPAVLMREPLGGVTNAEAEALVPKAASNLRAARDELAEAMANLRRVEQGDEPPLPYPEDVRLKGEIPSGTQVLVAEEPASESAATASEDEAAATTDAEPARRGEWIRESPSQGDAPAKESPPRRKPARATRTEAQPLVTEATAQPILETSTAEAREALRPSWEAPVEAEPEVVPEPEPEAAEVEPEVEPVDAYGTPMHVVESTTGRRSAGRVERVEEEMAPPTVDDMTEALDELAALPDEHAVVEAMAEDVEAIAAIEVENDGPAELEDDEEVEYEDDEGAELEDGEEVEYEDDEEAEYEDGEEEEYEDDEYEDEEQAELEDGEEEEYEDDEEAEYEYEDEEEAELEDGEEEEYEDDEEAEYEDDEEADEEDAEEAEYEDDEEVEYEEAAELEDDEEAELEDGEEEEYEDGEEAELEGQEDAEDEEDAEGEELEEELSVAASADETESNDADEPELAEAEDLEPVQALEEPEPVPEPSAEEAQPEPEPASAEEREVVLTPAAAPEAEAGADAEVSVSEELVYQSGCLFLQQGRVAVSMLQRKFDLGFDESCLVLDRLQDMGLIGPYMGGQRRDILMTEDQWQERVTAQ